MKQLDIESINAADAALIKPKGISPWLEAAANIHLKYFGENPTTLTLEEVRKEIIIDYKELPLLEVAMILMVVESHHKDLQAKRNLVPA